MSGLHGCPVNISYLYAMKKDELIELLKEQIKGLRDDNNRLLVQIDALTKEVSSLKEALLQKGESLGRQQRIAKGLAKLVSNTSERQQAPQPALSEEERRKAEAEKAAGRKARKNNGAIREGTYKPNSFLRVEIPEANGKKRGLGISMIVDRVVYQGINLVLEAFYEFQFSETSYDFRLYCGAHQE